MDIKQSDLQVFEALELIGLDLEEDELTDEDFAAIFGPVLSHFFDDERIPLCN